MADPDEVEVCRRKGLKGCQQAAHIGRVLNPEFFDPTPFDELAKLAQHLSAVGRKQVASVSHLLVFGSKSEYFFAKHNAGRRLRRNHSRHPRGVRLFIDSSSAKTDAFLHGLYPRRRMKQVGSKNARTDRKSGLAT